MKRDATAERKREFDAAHRTGMDALKRRDYHAFGEAITREKGIVDEQSRAIARKRKGPKER